VKDVYDDLYHSRTKRSRSISPPRYSSNNGPSSSSFSSSSFSSSSSSSSSSSFPPFSAFNHNQKRFKDASGNYSAAAGLLPPPAQFYSGRTGPKTSVGRSGAGSSPADILSCGIPAPSRCTSGESFAAASMSTGTFGTTPSPSSGFAAFKHDAPSSFLQKIKREDRLGYKASGEYNNNLREYNFNEWFPQQIPNLNIHDLEALSDMEQQVSYVVIAADWFEKIWGDSFVAMCDSLNAIPFSSGGKQVTIIPYSQAYQSPYFQEHIHTFPTSERLVDWASTITDSAAFTISYFLHYDTRYLFVGTEHGDTGLLLSLLIHWCPWTLMKSNPNHPPSLRAC
jgi:hypothetical protein